MKRYNCTLSDKRGEFGECMEAHSTGRYVLFSDVEKLQRRMQELLDKSNSTGVAIERAISSGSVLADHPLKSRLELLANHHEREMELAAQLYDATRQCGVMADLLLEARTNVDQVRRWGRFDHDEGCGAEAALLLERIDTLLAGQVKGRTITEGQEFELTTVLQSIANGFSDDPAHDAAALLKRIAGEVPWTGDTFQLPPRQAGLLCNQQHSLAGQVFAGLSAATALSVLDANSAADVVQLMLEAAEAKGGEPCDSASPSSSPA